MRMHICRFFGPLCACIDFFVFNIVAPAVRWTFPPLRRLFLYPPVTSTRWCGLIASPPPALSLSLSLPLPLSLPRSLSPPSPSLSLYPLPSPSDADNFFFLA